MQPQNQPAGPPAPIIDARRHPRFKIEVEIAVHSRTRGALKGHTLDISASGVAAILKMEVPLSEVVELEFELPFGPVRIYATVRQRNAFRYGFQFVEAETCEAVRATLRHLAVEQALFGAI